MAVSLTNILKSRRPNPEVNEKEPLVLTKKDFYWPLIFMLSLALVGLHCYPAILIVFAIIFNRWRKAPYDCVIMLMIMFGAYGLNDHNMLPGLKSYDLGLLMGIAGMIFLRKSPRIKLIIFMFLIYVVILYIISLYSWERFSIQLRTLRYYYSFVSFFIPLMVFAGKDFDIKVFFKRLMPFVFLMCAAYIIDGVILKGDLFAPSNYRWDGRASTFFHPLISPLHLGLHRKYPYGLYIMFMAIFPVMRYYRLNLWQWALLIIAPLVTVTFTFITALVMGGILFQGSVKRTLKIVTAAVILGVSLYFIDGLLPVKRSTDRDAMQQSFLRVRSSVDQIFMLFEAVDDEDLAEFGSGRMAQALPKLDLVSYYHREAIGLGFLHQELTKIDKLTIVNEYYIDYSNNEEVATGVEIIPIQIYINAGWIGLITHFLFFVGLYFVVCRLKYSSYYLSVLFCTAWVGLGGFASLAGYQGQQLVAFALAAVILANKPVQKKRSLLHNLATQEE